MARVQKKFNRIQKKDKMVDVIVFSHLRWDFVFQRPQQIMSRLAHKARIIFIEEDIPSDDSDDYNVSCVHPNIWVVKPQLDRANAEDINERRRMIIDLVLKNFSVRNYTTWYYTPMAYAFTKHLQPDLIVYDCMDELSAFKFAPPELLVFEKQLLDRADIVFTGGRSLYEAKCKKHPNVHCMPSSIDTEHFGKARGPRPDPQDQMHIPHPRIGFFGVVDERFDTELLRELAALRPDWHYVILGPVVKISEDELPRAANIHYLGMKQYDELPEYIANWGIAMLPFALNSATRFISPTKTPEYLAAGKPVIATPVRDVVRSYGMNGLVAVANDAESFAAAISQWLENPREGWLSRVDAVLAETSWDKTVAAMSACMQTILMKQKVI